MLSLFKINFETFTKCGCLHSYLYIGSYTENKAKGIKKNNLIMTKTVQAWSSFDKDFLICPKHIKTENIQ